MARACAAASVSISRPPREKGGARTKPRETTLLRPLFGALDVAMLSAPLSDYEVQRQQTILENDAKLRALLGPDGGHCARKKERSPLAPEELERRRAEKERQFKEAMESRRGSARLAERPARSTSPELSESARVLEWAEARQTAPKRARRAKSGKQQGQAALTDEERATLANAAGWLEQMREFLRPQISEPNLRNVMKVVTLLASGAGAACHTKHSGFFCKGRPIDMSSDFVALRTEANEWLHPDDDPGHGWRLDQ